MQKQWVDSNELFLKCVGSKFEQSVRVSLLVGEIIVTEVDEDVIPRFDAETEELKYLGSLKHWEKKLYHSTLEDYGKISRKIRIDLSTVCGILYALSEVSLHSRLEAEPFYQGMAKKTRFCAMKL